MKVIIYPQPNGNVTIIFPSDWFPLDEVAKKDVPAGAPYLIVDRDALPDLQFQEAWSADFSQPDGVGLGHDAWAAQYVDPEDIQMRNEAHSENARIDMWSAMVETAEQENRQFDALQALKVAS